MDTIKHLLIKILLASLPFALLGQNNAEKVNIPLSNPGDPGSLKIGTHHGTVTIEGHNGSELILTMTSDEDQKNKGEYSKQGLKRISNNSLDVTVKELNNNVIIQAGNNKNVNLHVKVPHQFSLDINTHHNGRIKVTDIKGEITANAHHGAINIQNVSGSVIAETHHGEIEVTFDEVTRGKTMAFSTYHGDVDITFPSTLSGEVKIKSSKGEIFTDFDIALKKPELEKKTSKNGAREIKMSGWTRGSIGSGGPELMFTTYHGDVVIRKN